MNETNEFKSKALMFIMLYISAFVLLYFINANQDDIIVYTSFATYRTSLYLIYALLAVNTLFAFMTLISYFSHRFDEIGQSEKEIEESKNPLSEEESVLQKLQSIIDNDDDISYDYITYAKRAIKQIKDGKQLIKDYKEITESNEDDDLANQPVIQNIGEELVNVRVRLLADAKSIYRRLLIGQDGDTILKKLEANDQILQEANDLVVEAINYIDAKTDSKNLDLESLAKSLKQLVDLL
jgi:hypothetical protein